MRSVRRFAAALVVSVAVLALGTGVATATEAYVPAATGTQDVTEW
ncbi:hypothetical protein ACWD4J_04045 [Streptomyces sp. NPDC002577]